MGKRFSTSKQRAEERTEMERAILQLEVEQAAAERDYRAYRSRIANRHRG